MSNKQPDGIYDLDRLVKESEEIYERNKSPKS